MANNFDMPKFLVDTGFFPKPPAPQAPDPSSKSIGGRTGISAYNGITLPDYKDPYDIPDFQGSKYYGIATGESMSPWSKLAVEQQNNLAAQKNAKSKAVGQGMAATNIARLEQQGGATSGARERAQEQAGKNVLSMVQGNNETAANNIGSIGIEDAKQRLAMLGDATNKLASMKAGNIAGQNEFSKFTTGELNKAVAADQSAKAQVQAAQASGGLSLLLLVSSTLMGSLSPSEAKASEQLSSSSSFTRLKQARKTFGSESALRGYCRISDALSPKIQDSLVAKKVVLYAMVKPIAKKGFLAKIWAKVFSLVGKVA